jgi:methylated-DNA-protein-cysteine methyltransferase-like protein
VEPRLRALYSRIYAVVRRIPRGKVATYGQIAELAGLPGGARVVGAAMRGSGDQRVPWQRVIGKRAGAVGRIAILDPIGGSVQRQLLEAEGIEVADSGAISLARFGWLPLEKKPAVRGGRGRAAPPRRPPRSASKRRASPSRR